MKIRLLTVSQRQPAWVTEGERDYARRLPREWGFEIIDVKPAVRAKGTSAERVRSSEAERLRAQLGRQQRQRLVVLDDRGDAWSSAELAERLRSWQRDGRDVALVIGGADGLDPELLQQADDRWSLSPATLPHGLVRIVVTEQLYRAATQLAGHPYHRA